MITKKVNMNTKELDRNYSKTPTKKEYLKDDELNGGDTKMSGNNANIKAEQLEKGKSEIDLISAKLAIIYEYDKHYLNLMKEYKEEIKFANTLLEDLRRERAQFFSQNLKEVSESLKNAQVDDKTAANWIMELVESYTKSLNISQELANTNVLDTFGKLKQESAKEINKLYNASAVSLDSDSLQSLEKDFATDSEVSDRGK